MAFSLEMSFTLISVIIVGCLSEFIDPVSVAWAFGALALVYYWTYFLLTFVACGFPLEEFRRASRNGLVVICVVSVGAVSAQLAAAFAARAAFYAVTMATVIAIWIRYLGGADRMRMLVRSKIGSEETLD